MTYVLNLKLAKPDDGAWIWDQSDAPWSLDTAIAQITHDGKIPYQLLHLDNKLWEFEMTFPDRASGNDWLIDVVAKNSTVNLSSVAGKAHPDVNETIVGRLLDDQGRTIKTDQRASPVVDPTAMI